MITLYWNAEYYGYFVAIDLGKIIIWYDDFANEWYSPGGKIA